ncbi:hypothetical protein ACQVP2_18495 [Methylobacterium aquaticum]|uniref:hypothetical protein n=1 Tax=Methylobacterium aquaticum TaxID=270351 RepID=UPI003D16C0AA
MADILFARGDLDDALRIRREEELPVYERLGDLVGLCNVRFNLAQLRLAQGVTDQESAQDVMENLAEAYRLAEHLGHAEAIAAIGALFGQVLSQAGAQTEAVTVLARAASAHRKLGREAQAAEIDALIAALPQPPAEPTA